MKFRRRKYLINAGMQIRYSILFVIIAVLGNICAVAVFNILASKKLDSVIWSTHISVASTDQLIGPLFIYVNAATFAFITILLILSGIWMIRNSSGPLFRMSKDINKIAEGDLSTNISLREKDEFQDVAIDLNQMTEKLREDFSLTKENCLNISKSLGTLKTLLAAGKISEGNYDNVLENINDLKSGLNRFQL
jgi:methyl-accepting chemotaxis protein